MICLVGYYGGFRNIELKSLIFENVECDGMGYWFTFARSKQRNKLEETTICVPRRQSDWMPCSADSERKAVDYDPASVIDSYFEAVMEDLDCKREDLKGCFFKGTHGKLGKRFINANIGKNTLAQVGIEIASELCLRDPETFTGHCWRRSAGTNASNSGVNVTTLMSMMGWACPKTAIQYVKRSRITSLQMSMYLANVQRTNCSDPFPCRMERKSRKKKFRQVENSSLSSLDTSPTTPFVLSKTSAPFASNDSLTIENKNVESEIHSEKDLSGCESSSVDNKNGVAKETNCDSNAVISESENFVSVPPPVVTPIVSVPSSGFDLSRIDPRLMNFLQNLQNNGSVNINFNFGDAKK